MTTVLGLLFIGACWSVAAILGLYFAAGAAVIVWGCLDWILRHPPDVSQQVAALERRIALEQRERELLAEKAREWRLRRASSPPAS
jgi:hypothetical protein